jgi:hypothetical protein
MKKINKKTTQRNMHGFNKISGPFLGNMQVDIRQNRVGGGGGGGSCSTLSYKQTSSLGEH